jgi:hypothetical protein
MFDYIVPQTIDSKLVSCFLPQVYCYRQFYHTSAENHNLEVSVHYTDVTTSTTYYYLCIQNSHKHHKLLDSIQSIYIQPNNHRKSCEVKNRTTYNGLTMAILNECCKLLNSDQSVPEYIRNIRNSIGDAYVVPTKFECFVVSCSCACVVILDPRILRKRLVTNRKHIACNFKCGPEVGNSSLNQQAKQHEAEVFRELNGTLVFPWPYVWNCSSVYPSHVIRSMFETDGVVVISLNSSWVSEISKQWCMYLGKLFGSDRNCTTLDELKMYSKTSRYLNQPQSTHVPKTTGKTSYGYYSKLNLLIFKKIQKIIGCVLTSGTVYECDFVLNW